MGVKGERPWGAYSKTLLLTNGRSGPCRYPQHGSGAGLQRLSRSCPASLPAGPGPAHYPHQPRPWRRQPWVPGRVPGSAPRSGKGAL